MQTTTLNSTGESIPRRHDTSFAAVVSLGIVSVGVPVGECSSTCRRRERR
jgi:hypothetical protein